MRALEYALREGWAGLLRGRGASAFTVLAIALAAVVLGALLLLTWNVEQVMARWTDAAEFSVHLRDDATSEQRGAVGSAVDASPLVAARECVSKADAQRRFREQFAEFAALAADLDENPFPASVEVRLAEGAAGDALAGLLADLRTLAGVADARYDQAWSDRLDAALASVRGVGVGLAFVMALSAAITVAVVVRLGLHTRRAEIEIMQLVGSPMAFIRGPFVVEGLLQGGLRALAALAALWAGFQVALAVWGPALVAVAGDVPPAFLPVRLCAAVVVGGMAVGALGGAGRVAARALVPGPAR
jgi:cell division transport system permease protein